MRQANAIDIGVSFSEFRPLFVVSALPYLFFRRGGALRTWGRDHTCLAVAHSRRRPVKRALSMGQRHDVVATMRSVPQIAYFVMHVEMSAPEKVITRVPPAREPELRLHLHFFIEAGK